MQRLGDLLGLLQRAFQTALTFGEVSCQAWQLSLKQAIRACLSKLWGLLLGQRRGQAMRRAPGAAEHVLTGIGIELKSKMLRYTGLLVGAAFVSESWLQVLTFKGLVLSGSSLTAGLGVTLAARRYQPEAESESRC